MMRRSVHAPSTERPVPRLSNKEHNWDHTERNDYDDDQQHQDILQGSLAHKTATFKRHKQTSRECGRLKDAERREPQKTRAFAEHFRSTGWQAHCYRGERRFENMPKKGERYESTCWLSGDGKPLVHLITRVAQGLVYYRADYGFHEDGAPWLGSPSSFPLEQTSRWLGRRLELRGEQ